MNYTVLKIFIIINLFHFGEPQPYPTNKQRTATIRDHCEDTRTNLFKSLNKNRYSYYGSLTGKELKTSGHEAIRFALNGNWGEAYEDLSNRPSFWTYFIFFGIGGGILLVSLPFLLCCIWYPDKCPPCHGYKKVKGETPNLSCVYCVSIFVIILGIITIGSMIAGLAVGGALQNSINEVQCGIGIVFDDALNGNSSIDGESFFIGVSSLQRQLEMMNENLSNITLIVEPISTTGTKVTSINTQIENTKITVARIPNGFGGNLILNYNSPFDSSTPITTIPSLFPTVLGNSTTFNTLTGNATLGLFGIEFAIKGISHSADEFEESIPSFKNSLSLTIELLETKSNELSSKDQEINMKISDFQGNQLTKAAIAYNVVAATIIFFTLLLVIAAIYTCNGKFACRKIMYLLCLLMAILGILSFCVSILFSFTTMGGYFACEFIKTGLSSPQNFISNFGHIIENPSLTSQLSVCVPTGSGNVIELVVGQDIYSLIDNLQSLSEELEAFDGDALLSNYESTYINLVATISNYQTAKIIDISSSSPNLAILERISDASQYTCSQIGFNSDSWIPSLTQVTTSVHCKIPNGAQFTGSSCPDFTTRETGCVGCIDTYEIFEGNTTAAQVLAALSTRYTESNCVTFNSDVSNTWNNFYRIKKDNIRPVLARATTATTDLNNIYSAMENDVIPVFNTAHQNLKITYSSIFDPKYGLLEGLNCRVIGEDMIYVSDQLCSKTFVHSYILRVMFIISSFSILFMLCLITCLGTINYRQEQIAVHSAPFTQVKIEAKTEAKTHEKFAPEYLGTETNARITEVH